MLHFVLIKKDLLPFYRILAIIIILNSLGGKFHMDEKNYVPTEIVHRNGSEITATVSNNSFKTLFYLLAGKPDSKFKGFNKNVVLKKDDIIELNQSIVNKLTSTNRVYENLIVTNVEITYATNAKNTSINGETFDIKSFIEHNFTEGSTIDSMIIKWDFMISLDQYTAPQRHTVMVRISTGLSSFNILQTLMSGNNDEISELDYELSRIFCRVDFINSTIADEIIFIIEKWVDSCSESPIVKHSWIKSSKVRYTFSNFIEYIIPFFGLIYLIGIFEIYFLTPSTHIETYFYWLLASIFFLKLMHKFGFYIAKSIFNSMNNYGEYCVFEITKGDINKKDKLLIKNKKIIENFVGMIIYTLVLGIIASIVATYISVRFLKI